MATANAASRCARGLIAVLRSNLSVLTTLTGSSGTQITSRLALKASDCATLTRSLLHAAFLKASRLALKTSDCATNALYINQTLIPSNLPLPVRERAGVRGIKIQHLNKSPHVLSIPSFPRRRESSENRIGTYTLTA